MTEEEKETMESIEAIYENLHKGLDDISNLLDKLDGDEDMSSVEEGFKLMVEKADRNTALIKNIKNNG